MTSRARVAVLGYGVIGKRVADAVRLQPDMQVAGVAVSADSPSRRVAQASGYAEWLATTDDSAAVPAGMHGRLADLLANVDVLLDCTPSGVPAHYYALYKRFPALPIIVQGGEHHEFGGVSFNAFANFPDAWDRKRVRVISCSSTGSARVIWALQQAFGVQQAFLSLWRRGADPGKPSKTPHNALVPSLGQSHHAPDVRTVMPGLTVYSMSADCPTSLAHVVTLQADVTGRVSRAEVLDCLRLIPRILVGQGARSTAHLADQFQDLGRSRGDRPEVYVWSDGVHVEGRTVVASFSVHMESITIPETVDCVRAVCRLQPDGWTSIHMTDRALGIEHAGKVYSPPRAR